MTDTPITPKQRLYRTPTRLPSPKQKQAKRARWKANRQKRVGGRPKGPFAVLIPDLEHKGFILVHEPENPAVDPKVGVKVGAMADSFASTGQRIAGGEVDGAILQAFESQRAMGKHLRRQKSVASKRTYRPPRPAKDSG